MQEKQTPHYGFAQTTIPWLVVGGSLLIYLLTLNRWVTLSSLNFVSNLAGWDNSLPQTGPLFFVVTYPIRWMPQTWQPILLNLFAAICSAFTLGLLARAVALLPHDRTHEQRQRERSEHSLLSVKAAWMPPVFAALVCGLQLTYWEHSIAGTSEAFDLLIFAYCVRTLLEYRIDQNEGRLNRLALIYGLGVTNNWALIGFFPGFLVALIWIKGLQFFQWKFILRMIGFGAIGLSLYLLLPLLWAFSDASAPFWEVLRANLGNQKLYLWNYSALRSRALLLSLTSILPVLIIGIRWPATFGDISAAGSFLTNFMFRVVHLVFLVFCILVAFDIALSPRALGYGLPFLTFYFLGALSVGYFTGYVLLVFSEVKLKSWQRRSGLSTMVHRLVYAAVWAGFIAAPAGLIYKNFPVIRELNGPTLHDWAAMTSEQLPKEGSLVLSDDIFQLHLIEAYYGRHGQPNPHMMVHTRSLTFPVYHRQLSKKYPQRWTSLADGDVKEPVETLALIQALSQMARTGSVHYLHPSFGYYFERLHAEPRGIVQQLHEYTADQFFPPPLTSAVESLNQKFWADHKAQIDRLTPPRARQIKDADFVAKLYSRAINAWGVRLQRNGRLEEAKNLFEWSFQLNTNNFAALVNRESNRSLRTGQSRRIDKETEQKFANLFQSWENMLAENGPFDDADFCFKLGEIFNSQSLFRQAAIELNRTVQLEPENLQARFALANIYLTSQRPDKVFEIVNDIRAHAAARPLSITNQLELVQFEAGAHFVKTNIDTAEKLLKDTLASHPDHLGLFDSLLQVYTLSGRVTNAIQLLDSRLQRHPGNASLLVQKANLFMTLKDWDAAVAVADQMLKNAPDDSQAKLLKGLALLQAKRFEPARAIFEGLRKDDPKHIDALLSLGAIYLEEKNYAKAIEVLDTVLEENRGHWAALRNRAIAHLKLGHYDEARRDYRAILQIVPRYTAAYYGLGEIAYQEKDRDEAIRYYELYLKHFPQSDSTELAEEKKMVTARLNELKAVER